MPKQEHHTFGEIALSKGLVSPDDFKLCVEIQVGEELAGGEHRRLGEILCARGHLTPQQVSAILDEQARAAGHARVGPYEAISRLGEGGMGSVYRARNLESGEEVALKVLSRKLARDPALLARFKREAEAIVTLDHPNIVKALAFGEENGRWYIAMEYLRGGDLRDRLAESGVMTEAEALGVVRDVASALRHALEKGMVHRDIKPSNVIFTKEGTAKLGDFGVVKQIEAEDAPHLTLDGTTVGTPHYISPEQARGDRESDIRSDIYSLGAMLYHLVTGRTPFEGPSALAIMQKHLTEKLTPPDELVPGLSDGCVAVIEKMMAKERSDRYQRPEEVVHDLERVLQGLPPERASMEPEKTMVQVSLRRRRRPSRIMRSATGRATRSSARGRRWSSLSAPVSSRRPLFLILLGLMVAAGAAVGLYYPAAPAPPRPKPPVAPKVVNPVPAPPPAAKPPAPASPPRVTRDQRAREALSEVLKFEGLAPDDVKGKLARLEAFIGRHPDTFAAARAAALINSLKAPPTPKPSPGEKPSPPR